MKLCVIPARGGSKRIPAKNIRSFAGRPIIAYSIEAALESKLFERVIVSTDDQDIADIAISLGAEVPFVRPPELSDDYATTGDVVKHCVNWCLENEIPVSYVCCLYATAPFVKSEYLREGYERLIATDSSYAFSVTSFPFPVQRAIRINADGRVEAIWPENVFKRSQDLEEAFHDAGQFYWGKAEAFLDDEVIFSSVSVPVLLPRYLVQDIDTIEDWRRAELMYEAWQSAGKQG